jgi:hypothetical protein
MSAVMLAATAAADSGFDWTKLIPIPAAIVAILGLAAVINGIIHPVSVQGPIYWHAVGATHMKMTVKNRLQVFDRSIGAIVFYKAPNGFLARTFRRKWRKKPSSLPYAPFGPIPALPFVLTKGNSQDFEFEICTPAGSKTIAQLDDTYRVEVKCGRRHSWPKKIELRQV